MKIVSLSFLLLAVSQPGFADVLSITEPSYSTPNNTSGVIRPNRGMDMAGVERAFGSPADKRAAVGDPPITRWSYPQFDVFFEHQLVIHSVVKRND